MDHIISIDGGKTWGTPTQCYLKEGIRNPQIAWMDGVYLLHGRNQTADGFVPYTSEDGENWDEGTYLGRAKGACYYSNNIVLKDKQGRNRLLIQYWENYGKEECVNIFHRFLTVEKH
jgi:hypothetical protein